ncbi:MAG: divergent polysaccharide deacetylase family protein [Pseudomonadota bacterium]
MAGNWKSRRRGRRGENRGWIGNFLRGLLAGGLLIVGAVVALVVTAPPPGNGPDGVVPRVIDETVREERGRSGPWSQGNFAGETEAPAGEVTAPQSAPRVATPGAGNVPVVAPQPGAGGDSETDLAGLVAPEGTGSLAPARPGAGDVGGLAAPQGFAPPAGLAPPAGAALGTGPVAGGSAGGPVDSTVSGTVDSTGGFGAALPQGGAAPAPGAALQDTPGDGASLRDGVANPLPFAPEIDASRMTPEEARAALAALEAEEAALLENAPIVGQEAREAGPDTVAGTVAGSEPAPVDPPAAGDGAAPKADGWRAAEEQLSALAADPVEVSEGAAVPEAEGAPPVESAVEPPPTPQAAATPDAPPETEPQPEARLAPEPEPEPEPADPVLALAGPALTVNALSYETAAGKVPVALVLLDGGKADGLDPAMLSAITAPLAVGVISGTEGATDLAGAARAAGHEVVVELPFDELDGRVPARAVVDPGLDTAALEARLTAALARVQEGVAVMAVSGRGPAKATAPGLFEPLSRHGFGFVEPRTLGGRDNMRAAQRAGLSAISADRTVPATATEAQVYQMLTVAAGVAKRQGSAVIVAPASPATLRAAMQWTLEGARGGAELAPLSAVMRLRAGG